MSRFKVLERSLTVILVLCAVAVSMAVVRQEFFASQKSLIAARVPPPTKLGEWRRYAVSDMRIGPTGAPVVMIEFSDFQCPYCELMYQTIKGVQERFPGKVLVVYRNFPLAMLHPFAANAARAAECAAKVGRFASFYDYAFRHQDSLRFVATGRFAQNHGIADSLRFETCLSSAGVAHELSRDSSDAMRLGIRGTPLLLINQWRIDGVRPDSVIVKYVENVLAAVPPA